MGRMIAESTSDRILATFLRLAAERGMEATTTRVLAEAAGVNEVTVFRHFGDKAGLAREAIRRFSPVATFEQYEPAVDTTGPDTAAEGILRSLRFVRGQMREHPEVMSFGVAESWRFPDLSEEIRAIPLAALAVIERTLHQAQPCLRAEVDLRAAALSFQAVLFMTAMWRSRGWTGIEESAGDRLLEALVRPLLRAEEVR